MVALDTNIYIYFLDKNLKFFSMAERAMKYAIKEGAVCVPVITLMEIISGASKSMEVIDFFANPQFEVYDFAIPEAVLAGELRYKHVSLKSAYAIHLATAMSNQATQFISNDKRLEKLKLDIEIIPFDRFQ